MSLYVIDGRSSLDTNRWENLGISEFLKRHIAVAVLPIESAYLLRKITTLCAFKILSLKMTLLSND